MTIPTEIKSVLLAQSKSDTLQQVADSLKDSTNLLNDGVVRDLLHIAQRTAFVSDDTIVPRLAQHLFASKRLTKKVHNALSQIHELKRQLADIRTYLGVGTDEELSAAVAAGRKHVAVPKTDRDKIMAEAEARRKAAQAAQQAAKK
jgi:hypothetical protein